MDTKISRYNEVFEETIYWTDSGISFTLSCHKFSGENVTVENDPRSTPYGPHVYSNSVQIIDKKLFPSGPNPCLSINCSQLCLIKEGGTEGTCYGNSPIGSEKIREKKSRNFFPAKLKEIFGLDLPL